MRWSRKGNAFVCDELTPDLLKERDARLSWAMVRKLPWSLINGSLVPRKYEATPQNRFFDLKLSGEELRAIMFDDGRRWALKDAALAASGVAQASRGPYGAPGSLSNTVSLSAVTGGTANVPWWAPGTYTSIPGQIVQAPCSWRCYSAGLITSSGAGQTITMNPAIGTAVAGQALGASAALALGGTIANAFWRSEATIIARTGGPSGSAVAECQFAWGTTTGATPGTPTATNPSNALYGAGNTVATVDWTGAQGFLMAATPSAAGVSVTPTIVVFTSND